MKYLEYEVKNNTVVRAASDKTTPISGSVNYFGLHISMDQDFTDVPGEKAVEFFKDRVRQTVNLTEGYCIIPNDFLETDTPIEFRVVSGNTLGTPWVSITVSKSGAVLPEEPPEPAPVGEEYVTSDSGENVVTKLRVGENGLEYSKNGQDYVPVTGEKVDPTEIVLLNDGESEVSAVAAKVNEIINALAKSGIVKVATGEERMEVYGQEEQVTQYGNKPISDLFGADVNIEWYGVNGKVKGTFHNVTEEWEDLPKAPKTGHFFVMKFTDTEKYIGKPFTFKKDSGKPSTTQEATEDEMFWVLCIDTNKKFTFESDGEVIVTLDFTEATLEGV